MKLLGLALFTAIAVTLSLLFQPAESTLLWRWIPMAILSAAVFVVVVEYTSRRACWILGTALAVALIVVGDGGTTLALAQGAAAAPEMTWLDFAKGAGAALLAYVKGPAVVAFLMAQARAVFPWLGNLGILTLVGDAIAGNWGHAKNAG